jgi:hypothetical protein
MSPEQVQATIERLKREGRMPSMEQFADAVLADPQWDALEEEWERFQRE